MLAGHKGGPRRLAYPRWRSTRTWPFLPGGYREFRLKLKQNGVLQVAAPAGGAGRSTAAG
jgi:hypothetical protein